MVVHVNSAESGKLCSSQLCFRDVDACFDISNCGIDIFVVAEE